MDIFDKINIIKEFIDLPEFKNKIVALNAIWILKVRYLFEENNDDEFIKKYFRNFNFENTHLFIKWDVKRVYFPKDNSKYIELLWFMSLDIEVENNLEILDKL